MNASGLSSGEYLYGFKRSSRLCPVMTFVLYSGVEKWGGPTCLHDMLDFTEIPVLIRKIIPDYKINVISIREIQDTSMFKTDLRYVLDFLRCAEDKEKLQKLVEENTYVKEMAEDAYDVVTNYANIQELAIVKEQYKEAGEVDMCKAIKEMIEEGRMEGRIDGIISTARRYHASEEDIMEQLMEEFDIDKEKAWEYLADIE